MLERTPDFAKNGLDSKVALDAVFRRNVLARPGALALCDPSDRAGFMEGKPRRLNYAEADATVSRLAAQFRALGLPDGSAVALQLPNTVEFVLSLLALFRAGLVAVPLPLLWRRADLVAALREINARAIVTVNWIGEEWPAEIACQAAAELFSLGFPCAFGESVPDGVVRLTLDAATPSQKADLPNIRVMPDAIAMATFDASRGGAFAVGRSHAQWIAAGFSTMLEARISAGEVIVSTLPPASLAGIASAFVPWLLTGGTLSLVHGYSPQAVKEAADDGSHLVAPAPALHTLSEASRESFSSCIAVHRGPQSLGVDLSHANCEAIVDIQAFGEIGLVAQRRIAKIMPSPVPLGEVPATANSPGAPVVIETQRLADGTLAVRGPMVPDRAFPDPNRAEASRIEFELDGYVRTNLRCHSIGASGLAIEASPEGIIAVGGLRYGIDELAMRVANGSPGSIVSTERDSLLGVRLTVESDDPAEARKTLDEAGQSRLISEGVKQRAAERRAG